MYLRVVRLSSPLNTIYVFYEMNQRKKNVHHFEMPMKHNYY